MPSPLLHMTPLTSILTDTQVKMIKDSFPLKRVGDPDGLGALVCYLASDYASFITGATITVDGGTPCTDTIGISYERIDSI